MYFVQLQKNCKSLYSAYYVALWNQCSLVAFVLIWELGGALFLYVCVCVWESENWNNTFFEQLKCSTRGGSDTHLANYFWCLDVKNFPSSILLGGEHGLSRSNFH